MTIISPPLFAFIDKMSPPRYVHLKKKIKAKELRIVVTDPALHTTSYAIQQNQLQKLLMCKVCIYY